MNTDFLIYDELPRSKQYNKNITSGGDTRYYNDSCKNIREYANEQNTVYDSLTNQMLYGINSSMQVSGVSDGTCNQINPYIFQPKNICGAGAAGGNRCIPDAYPQAYKINSKNNINLQINNKKKFINENFDSEVNLKLNNYNSNSYNITHLIIIVLLIIFFIGIIYSKF
jgi:hypothetical protein